MSVTSPRALVAEVLSPEAYRGPHARPWVQGALILAASLIFGFQFVVFKQAFKDMEPMTLSALRALVLLPVLFAMMRWTRVPIHAERASLLRVAVPSALLVGSQSAFIFGVHRLPAGLTSTIVSMSPIFTILVGLALRSAAVARIALAGSLVSTVGVAIATGALEGHVDGLGLGLMLLSNLCYAASLVTLKQLRVQLSGGMYLIVMAVLSVVVYVPAAAGLDGFHVDVTWRAVGCVLYVSVLGHALAYIFTLGLLRFAGAFQAALVTPLIPVFAILFAVLLLGEPLLGRELAGGALIIAGVVAAVLPARRAAHAA